MFPVKYLIGPHLNRPGKKHFLQDIKNLEITELRCLHIIRFIDSKLKTIWNFSSQFVETKIPAKRNKENKVWQEPTTVAGDG